MLLIPPVQLPKYCQSISLSTTLVTAYTWYNIKCYRQVSISNQGLDKKLTHIYWQHLEAMPGEDSESYFHSYSYRLVTYVMSPLPFMACSLWNFSIFDSCAVGDIAFACAAIQEQTGHGFLDCWSMHVLHDSLYSIMIMSPQPYMAKTLVHFGTLATLTHVQLLT